MRDYELWSINTLFSLGWEPKNFLLVQLGAIHKGRPQNVSIFYTSAKFGLLQAKLTQASAFAKPSCGCPLWMTPYWHAVIWESGSVMSMRIIDQIGCPILPQDVAKISDFETACPGESEFTKPFPEFSNYFYIKLTFLHNSSFYVV